VEVEAADADAILSPGRAIASLLYWSRSGTAFDAANRAKKKPEVYWKYSYDVDEYTDLGGQYGFWLR
jgi:hypothetical protein